MNPADTLYSKRQGGRWNPPGEFGSLCLSADVYVTALGFTDDFPYKVAWLARQSVAREAHAAGLSGIAARFHAEITATANVGEELALFEETNPRPPIARRLFHKWYPDPIAG